MKKLAIILVILSIIFTACGGGGKLPFKGDGFGGPQNEKEAAIAKEIKHKPVILVHGLWSSSSVWWQLRDYLIKNGYTPYEIFAIDYTDSPNWLANELQKLRTFINNVRKYTKKDKIVLVGHSKGGLLIRMYIQMTGGKNITHAITLGAPNKGTPKGRNKILRPGSSFIKSLNDNLFDVKYLCFAAETDRWYPSGYEDNAFIKGAKNVRITGTDHVSVAKSGKAFKILLDFISNN